MQYDNGTEFVIRWAHWEPNKTILKKANKAVSNGNYEEFLKYCTDDTKWIFIGDQVLHGKEGVRKWMLKEYIEPPIIHVEKLIGEHELYIFSKQVYLNLSINSNPKQYYI